MFSFHGSRLALIVVGTILYFNPGARPICAAIITWDSDANFANGVTDGGGTWSLTGNNWYTGSLDRALGQHQWRHGPVWHKRFVQHGGSNRLHRDSFRLPLRRRHRLPEPELYAQWWHAEPRRRFAQHNLERHGRHDRLDHHRWQLLDSQQDRYTRFVDAFQLEYLFGRNYDQPRHARRHDIRAALGSGNITLNDASTGANNTAIVVSASNNLSNNLTVASQGSGLATLTFSGSAAVSGSYSPFNSLTLNNATSLNFAYSGGSSYYIFGSTVSGSGPVSITSGSNYLLAGASWSSYTGPVTIAGGSNFDLRGMLGSSATNAITVNGTMWDVSNDAIGSLSGSGTVSTIGGFGNSNETLTVGNGGASSTFSGVIGQQSHILSLTKVGSGDLTLLGINSFTGSATISTGTLAIGGAGSLGGSYAANIAIGNGAVLNYGSNAAQTFSGVISGSGALIQSGNGLLSLTNGNSYLGGTIVNGGTLSLGFNNGAAGTLQGALTINQGGTVVTAVNNALWLFRRELGASDQYQRWRPNHVGDYGQRLGHNDRHVGWHHRKQCDRRLLCHGDVQFTYPARVQYHRHKHAGDDQRQSARPGRQRESGNHFQYHTGQRRQ